MRRGNSHMFGVKFQSLSLYTTPLQLVKCYNSAINNWAKTSSLGILSKGPFFFKKCRETRYLSREMLTVLFPPISHNSPPQEVALPPNPEVPIINYEEILF